MPSLFTRIRRGYRDLALTHVLDDLPITARSHTVATIRRRERRNMPFFLLVWFGCMLPIGASLWLDSGQQAREVMRWFLWAVAIGTPLVVLIVWLRARQWRHYLDPGLTLEVRRDGMTVRNRLGRADILYAEAVFGEHVVHVRGNTTFLGIWLRTPLVEIIRLEDGWFDNGRRAAAAIVQLAAAARAET